ncbi:D-alanyl-D-alanine carboxypeptidase [Candidatus Coxiella mudrowiae]|uniref:D-alanyl-D-alanine carboxypeptidase n=1 Tax=Candidatus Coxiella mudrowiae TaxID=2054173 RepID=UPI001F251D76|nr:D-alanyl-D-alanine carboxypeptidase [Candidatus Coxiella mudrowiae]
MGEIFYQEAGSSQNGLRALKKILASTGINFKDNLINDGAELSRYNLVSPD